MKPPHIERVFLSCASTEFAPERRRLANHLRALIAPRFEVAVQEDFKQGGNTLLERIAEYIRGCDLMIHIVGDVCGLRPTSAQVAALYQRLGEPLPVPVPVPDFSYTQWEYHLARKFDKRVLVYLAEPQAPRRGPNGAPPTQSSEDACRQEAHVRGIRESGEHREPFASANELLKRVLYDISPDGVPPHKASNIDVKSLGPLFKGRDDFLAQIRAALGEMQHTGVVRAAVITATATTVYGLGGIGKTRAAIEYAHRHADDYTALLMVRADSPEKLDDNLAELCGPMVLDLPEHQNPDAEVRIAAAQGWLRQHPGWFLILDNVDTEDAAAAVESLLGRLEDAGQVLITSRIRNWSAAVSTLQLDVLPLDDSVAFLLERTEGLRLKRPDDAAQARAVAEALGQLALALEQAGAHIGQEHLSFEKYLAQWTSNRDKVMRWFDPRLMQYPVSVAVTWLTTFEQLGASAHKLLRTLAWFAPDPVPGSVFDDSGTLAELAAYSLLTSNDEGGFSVHRLVQEVTRAQMDADQRRDALADAVVRLDQAFKGDADDPSAWPLLESLASHGQTLALANVVVRTESTEPDNNVLSSGPDIDGRQAALGLRLGNFFFATGRFMQACSLQSRSVAFYRQALGEENPDTLTAMDDLAATLYEQGDLSGARGLQEKVLEARRRVLGEEHPDTLGSMGNLALTLQAQGDLSGARGLQEKMLDVWRRVSGEEHPDTLTAMNNLAGTLLGQGDLSGARGLQQKVLQVRRRVSGEEHPDTLTAMDNLALTLYAQGDLSAARGLQQKEVEVRRRVLGEEHPDTLTTLNNLALTLYAQGNLFGACGLLQKVLEARRRVSGEEHPDTLAAMGNLALTLYAQGDLSGARGLQQKVLEARRRVSGEEHPHTLTAMGNLALTLYAQGDLSGARGLQQKVLEARQRVSGEEHPDTLGSMGNLAHTLYAQGDLSGARGLQQKVLEARRRVSGEEHPDTLTAMGNLALTLCAQGDLFGARGLQQKVLEARRRVSGEEHPDTLAAMGNLAQTLYAQGDLSGARGLQQKVLEARRRLSGEEHPHTLTAMGNLALTLYAQGDLSGARGLQQKVLEARRRVSGEEHPDTLTAMGNLAHTLYAQGDLSGARGLQEKELEARQRVSGEEHPDTLGSMGNLAHTLYAQGDLSGARGLQQKVLEARRRLSGEEHPHTLTAMGNLALTLYAQGDLSGARGLQEKELEVRRRVLGERHPITSLSAWNLGRTLRALREEYAWVSLRTDCLDWLLSASSATLSADQIKIRGLLAEQFHVPGQRPSRNAPCPCGSGLRYKHCCGRLAG
ncbi:tetratricopeptide (TPR) repeat protein [Paraburkholderia sp. UCT70]|uniref:tetratricopeptide repeat protein n=1 Tax=Paraburkholderia sp. UCT70 TaxID=2991068 RepID=UPI003D22C77C